METRKLQAVGGGTFTVSLPKDWANNNGFRVGMELHLYTHRDGSILIRSSEMDIDRLNEARVDVDGGGSEAVRRAVRTAHKSGFETITLRPTDSFSEAERKAARSTVRNLVGANILSESETEITIGHLLDTSAVSIRQSVVQLQYSVVPLLGDAADVFVDGRDTHERVRDRADEARRSAEMVTRHFSRSLVSYAELDALDTSRSELFTYYTIASCLETVADQSVRIAATGEELAEPLSDEAATDVRSVAEDVACAVDDAVTAVLSGDMATVQQARRGCNDAIETIETVEGRLYDGGVTDSVPAAVALANTLSGLRRAADCGHSLADTAAMTVVRDQNLEL